MDVDYEDNYWHEDAVFMERNSRDFVSRNQRINENAAAISQILRESPHGQLLYMRAGARLSVWKSSKFIILSTAPAKPFLTLTVRRAAVMEGSFP